MFMASMRPNAKAKSQHDLESIIDTSDLVPGKERFLVSSGMPVLVKQVAENEYVVMLLESRFSRNNVRGCLIKQVSEFSNSYTEHPKGTAYMEICRGVWYDENGNVLSPSHPAALPILRLKWEHVPNARKKIRIYT
jgi:hypothetical protein